MESSFQVVVILILLIIALFSIVAISVLKDNHTRRQKVFKAKKAIVESKDTARDWARTVYAEIMSLPLDKLSFIENDGRVHTNISLSGPSTDEEFEIKMVFSPTNRTSVDYYAYPHDFKINWRSLTCNTPEAVLICKAFRNRFSSQEKEIMQELEYVFSERLDDDLEIPAFLKQQA